MLCNRVLVLASCLASQVILSAGEPSFPALVSISRNVVYGTEQEPMHRADIYRPRALSRNADIENSNATSSDSSSKSSLQSASLLPAVVIIHGGAWTLGDKMNDTVHAKKLAARGYCVLSINYRLAPQHRFPAQLDDCKLALRWLTENAEDLGVDPNRIGVWGYSAGGHLAALLSLQPEEKTPRPKVCVSGGTPFDLRRLPPDSGALSGVFGGTPREKPEVYHQASPMVHVSRDDPPIFLFHGNKDWLVPEENSIAMKQELEAIGVPFEQITVPNKGHLATFVDMKTIEKSFEFLDIHLRPDSTWRRDGSGPE